jgi:pimeloyl-ACP methyl ester carboxylesterase
MPREDDGSKSWIKPFVAGLVVGGAGLLLTRSLSSRRGFDHRLIRATNLDDLPPVLVVPGIMGSELLRPNGAPVWLNVGNALGHYDLSLPYDRPLGDCTDELVPGGLLGTAAVLPRLFGFTEYADLTDLLGDAGFSLACDGNAATRYSRGGGAVYHIFSYDWRRDLIESARRLHETLERLADERGDPDLRFNVIGHSMGGLVARYYLRYGTAEPTAEMPVTWAGARRIQNLVLVAVPSAGSIPALEGILCGNRVGLSATTLAAPVVARMPSVYQLLPPRGAPGLLDHGGAPLDADLHDPATWDRFGWGPYSPSPGRRGDGTTTDHRAFLDAVLARASVFHRALARPPASACPRRVIVLGGDCLPTLARAVVPEKRGALPRFEPWHRAESDAMFEAGDGRVARASVLASHLPSAEESDQGCGIPEVSQAFFGSADHHGIYDEPTFQSILLRLLMRPVTRRPLAIPRLA